MENLKNQSNILDMFPELSYEELKEVMDAWLNPDAESDDDVESSLDTGGDSYTPQSGDDEEETVTAVKTPKKAAVASPSAAASKKSSMTDDVSKAFDDLFNS